jgi:hypothetical protein
MDEHAPQQTVYWPYHQGAFYMLSADLLVKVSRNKEHLQGYYMEDAMVGAWVVGLEKEVINIAIDHECYCKWNAEIYHHCSSKQQFDECFEREHGRCFSMSG